MSKRARIKARSPEEFERWRRLAEEVRQEKSHTNVTPTTEASK